MPDSTVTLREYLDNQIDNIKDATKIALTTLERRLEGLNEWRLESKDRQVNFPTRMEIDAQIKTIQSQLDQLKTQSVDLPTRNEVAVQFDRINADLRDLLKSRDNLAGKASQNSVTITLIISIVGIIIGIASIAISLRP